MLLAEEMRDQAEVMKVKTEITELLTLGGAALVRLKWCYGTGSLSPEVVIFKSGTVFPCQYSGCSMPLQKEYA